MLQEIGQYVLRLWCEYYQEWIHVKVDSFVPIDLNGGAAYEGKPGLSQCESMMFLFLNVFSVVNTPNMVNLW